METDDGQVETIPRQSMGVALKICKTAGVCGGRARMGDTRIPVWTLVSFREMGMSDEELLQSYPYPGLSPEHLKLAWEYYESHRDEIARDIQEQDADHGDPSWDAVGPS